MGGVDCMVFISQSQKGAGEPGIKAGQGDIFDELFKIGKAMGYGCEDPLAKRWIFGEPLMEGGGRNDFCVEVGFGDTFGAIAASIDQAGKGLQADVAGANAIQYNFASIGGAHGDAD